MTVEDRAGCFTLLQLYYMPVFVSLCSGSFPYGAMSWSVTVAFNGHTHPLLNKFLKTL